MGRLLEQEKRKGLGTVTLAEYAYDEQGRPITIWDANGLDFSVDDFYFTKTNNLTIFVAVPGFYETTTVRRYDVGYEPYDVVTIRYNQLDYFRKRDLKARYEYAWRVHLEFGQCPEGVDCKNLPWPGR